MESFSSEELKEFIDDYILSGGGRTRAFGVREVLYKAVDSLFNNKDGGFKTEAITGYKTLLDLEAADGKAFVHKAYLLSLLENATGTVKQLELTSPLLTSNGTICTWTIPNTLYDPFAQPMLVDQSNNIINALTRSVTAVSIVYTIYSSVDIAAGTFRCSIQGKQKTAPEPPTSDYVEGDYVEGDYVL